MSLLSRASSQPLTDQLAQRFVTRMRDQLLVSGARLPSVRQCAQMHGVSASTVVAAYDWLVAQGWVEARPNRGFFVRDRVQRTAVPAAGRALPSPPPVNAASLIRGMFHQPSAVPQPGMGVFPPEWLDADFLSAALRKVVEARCGMTALAAQTQLSRETLYRTLSARGNPTIKTLAAVLKATGLRISIAPDP
jgi:probable addiction module antidote protein